MQRAAFTRVLIAGVPLISLISLALLFSYVASGYVRCERGNCDGIGQNIQRVLADEDPKTSEPLSGESAEDARKKAILKFERAASIYSGRLSFTLLLVANLLVCAIAFAIGCIVITRSLAETTTHPTRWLFIGMALSMAVGLIHYYQPDTLGIVGPVFERTTSHDVRTIGELLKRLTSFGYAVILFLSFAVCAVVFWGNASAKPDDLKRLSLRMKRLQLVLYAGTLMLVLAVLLMQSVSQWSLAFIPPDGQKAATALFSGILTVEGGFLTLVLAAVYLPAAFLLQKRAESLPDLPETEPQREEALKNYNLAFSLSQSLPRIAAILGPVLVGPIGEMLGRLGSH